MRHAKARLLLLAALVLVTAVRPATAWSAQAGAPAGKSAAALKRDSTRCSVDGDIDACYDAIRWNPGSAPLLVALGDALLRAQRPADALRNYRRAAEIAPNTRGIAAKISTAEARLHARRAPPKPATDVAALNAGSGKHFTNAAPETQSH
jgi:cytochrome c-type biogenesis protein CcmH/NrfG